MATISTRIDDDVKTDAERIADQIGISLSTAINIFLKQFVADRGFSFPVVARGKKECTAFRLNEEELDTLVKEAVSDPNNAGHADHFTYIDSNKSLTTIHKED